MPPASFARRALAVGLCLAALAAGAAQAQTNAGADRRLDKVERDLRTLQTVVMQAQASGQPVVVKPEGPDPGLTALQTRVDDLEMTLTRINGQVETLTHDLDEIRRADTAVDAERQAQTQLLNDRLSRIEAQLAALTQAATAADPSLAAAAPAPASPAAPAAGQGAQATGRAQAQDTSTLGGGTAAPPPPPPPPPPPKPPTAAESFNAAHALFTAGQVSDAADAFQDFVSRYPTNPRTPEAFYWLGESFYAQKSYQNAVAAYASALKNRPTTAWAPAAMVRLAQALTQSNQDAQACAALTEFTQRYAARAPAALKANAEATRRRARCT